MDNIIKEVENYTADLQVKVVKTQSENETLLKVNKLQQDEIEKLTMEQSEILNQVLEAYQAINDEYTLKAIRSLGTLLNNYHKHP